MKCACVRRDYIVYMFIRTWEHTSPTYTDVDFQVHYRLRNLHFRINHRSWEGFSHLLCQQRSFLPTGDKRKEKRRSPALVAFLFPLITCSSRGKGAFSASTGRPLPPSPPYVAEAPLPRRSD